MAVKKRNQMTSELQDAHDSMLQGLSELAKYFGLNGTLGQIYGVLLLHEDPLSLEELAQQVGKSKSSISNYTRILEYFKMIRHVNKVSPDLKSNQKYYELETNFQIVAYNLAQYKFNELDQLQRMIETSFTQLKMVRKTRETSEQAIDIQIERIGLLFSLINMINDLITSWIEALPEKSSLQT